MGTTVAQAAQMVMQEEEANKKLAEMSTSMRAINNQSLESVLNTEDMRSN